MTNTNQTMSISDMQNAIAMSGKNLTEAQIGLSEKIGALKATAFFKKLVTVTEIKLIAEIKETKQYKGFQLIDTDGKLVTVTTFQDFCQALGHSYEKINQDLQNLATFGEDFLETSQRMGLGYRDLRKLRKLPEEEQALIINGEAVRTEDKESLIDMIEELSAKHRHLENEMRVKFNDLEQDNKAKERVITEKGKKIDELNIKLNKKEQSLPKPTPADTAQNIILDLIKVKQTVRSEISKLREIFANLINHGETHGFDHTALMVGAINQLILDCEILRGQYLLPTDPPTGEVPVWLTQDEPVGADD